ncbi:MAG: hypothetical protein JWN38_1, partial [Candidatus Saccharibacteria bacterium]|nr:hypothetical protein [Candidatus Saccharibacteria bacterium]
AMEHQLPIIIFNSTEPDNILNAAHGRGGTTIN